ARNVTGVQTCALPIYRSGPVPHSVYRKQYFRPGQRLSDEDTLLHLEIDGEKERLPLPAQDVHPASYGIGIEKAHALRPFKKFSKMIFPHGVMMDSGWNCTPCTSYTRCESAITVPASSRAVTSRQSGIVAP